MNIFMLLMLLIFIPVFVFVTLDRSELARYWLSESWDWLSDGESGSTTIRNLGLVLAGLIALPLAIWRSMVAQRQAETAERGLLNERFQKGAEMLGSRVLSVRLAGIFALAQLAAEHPKEYHIQVMRLLCAFVRNPTSDEEIKASEDPKVRQDVQIIMYIFNGRSQSELALEKGKITLDLVGADLRRSYISTDMSGAILSEANLSHALITQTDLSEAFLNEANLSGAEISGSNLCGARLHGANLSGALLRGNTPFSLTVFGLTQAQIDEACADADNPPKLDGVLDAETGEPLVWRGGPC